MTVISIDNPDLLKIVDEKTNRTYYGCDQKWYASEWQRISGCGPSVASNLIFYLRYSETVSLEQGFNSKERWLSLMEEIWEHVTPSQKGIPTTKMFYQAVVAYAGLKGLNVKYYFCNVSKDKSENISLTEIMEFIKGALINNAPVAFLNLCNGAENNLDPWHWVTIISLEYTKSKNNVFVNILDEGIKKRINLKLWYDTTTLGGGFVYFKYKI